MSEMLNIVKSRDPNEPEFLQTVTEVYESLKHVLDAEPKPRRE